MGINNGQYLLYQVQFFEKQNHMCTEGKFLILLCLHLIPR